MHCPVDWSIRQHAEDDARADEEFYAISERVSELTEENGEFYPFKVDHIAEFLGSMTSLQEHMLASALKTPGANYSDMLRGWVETFWRNLAEKQARKELRV